MDQYDAYRIANPLFYDEPTLVERDEVTFPITARPLPDGWTRTEQDDWLVYWRDDAGTPKQGWKVHVSACLDNADAVLDAVWNYCLPRRICFKFLRTRLVMLQQNGKYAHRGSSGKLVTIYPTSDEQLEAILRDLDEALCGQPGPYILSDLRYGDGPLYVRYGGFAERNAVFDRGVVEPAIVDGTGQLVPDRREPGFRVPEWVSLPAFLEPHLRARSEATVEQIPYAVKEALHFSNGGGLYRAEDTRTGETVVLKEARPYAGLSGDGQDAVARLNREALVLGDLAGLDAVPALRDRFVIGGHHFLVQDFVDGKPLRKVMVARHPLLCDEPDADKVVEYTRWALGMSASIEAAVGQVHERGVVINDLHPYNVLVREDGSIALIDFEVASRRDETARPALGDPAFAAPRAVTGVERDRYALACIRLFFFLPLTALFELDAGKAEDLAEAIAAHFPVPAEFLAEAVEVIVGAEPEHGKRTRAHLVRPTTDPARWPEIARSLADGILAAATPDRDDRLFPGDVGNFRQQTPGLANGASGVLYALAMSGHGVDPAHVDWLEKRATAPVSGTSLGFYDGLHGAAYVLEMLGRRQAALDVVDICLREQWTSLGSNLSSGLAGIGLNLAHLAERTGESSLAQAAQRAVDILAERLGDVDSVPEISGKDHRYAGLLRGSSGVALLFLRQYERTGDTALLDLAETALRQDLRRCVVQDDGSLQVNEGWRTMPYLLDGSVGIGMVLDDFLRHRPSPDLDAAASQIRRAACGVVYVEPNLFSGRAGMILYLSRLGTAHRNAVAQQIGRLDWHALTYRGHLAFPGEKLLRLSMDLASGSAGVLLALASAINRQRAYLPFLGPGRPQIPGPHNGVAVDRAPARLG